MVKRLKRMIWHIIIALGGVYILLVALLFLFQGSLVYRPTRQLINTPDQMGMQYENVSLQTSDGVKLHGWFMPGETEKGTVLMFHGN
ncbi:MAG: alpha/beta hydrolase, partial [bacterium]|nr:alpha/beta hydrolase [bacterium]